MKRIEKKNKAMAEEFVSEMEEIERGFDENEEFVLHPKKYVLNTIALVVIPYS